MQTRCPVKQTYSQDTLSGFKTRSRAFTRPKAHKETGEAETSRRSVLTTLSGSLLSWCSLGNQLAYPSPASSSAAAAERCWPQLSQLAPGVCYAQQGPLVPLELPRLEHTCTSCFPACVGDKCLLSIEVTYPKGGSLLGLSPPYPLAIFSGGFTVSSAAYRSTAARLTSWGYTVVRYNTRDALPDVLDDVTCVKLLRELIDWAATHPLMRRLADTRRVYATGHSRGAKLAALTAAADSRIAALCLVDPVDVTQYAPLSDRFPSAAAALEGVAQTGRFLPVAVVGSGQAGDCAPQFNNYHRFFQASPSAAWEVLLPSAGHFQYLDSTTALQRAVCGGGGSDSPDDADVRRVSQAALVAWGEALVKLPGHDVLSCLAARCASIGGPYAGSSSGSGAAHYQSQGSAGSGWLPPPADTPLQALPHQQEQQQSEQGLVQIQSLHLPQNSLEQISMPASLQKLQQQQQPEGQLQQEAPWQQQPPLANSNSSWSSSSSSQVGGQQMQQPLPLVQTRQEVWLAPPPGRLRALRADLERLLVAVSYQSAAALEVRSRYRNFG